MKNFALTIALAAFLFTPPAKESYLLVGTYTTGKSVGIYVFKFNHATGEATEVSHVETSNPSFLAVSKDGKFVYAVNEDSKDGNGGTISSFSFNKTTGELTFINKQLTKGDSPCFVDLDKTGKWAVATNYSSGNIAVFPINADGSLDSASSTVQYTGSGPNTSRQEKSHAHSAIFSSDNKWLYAADLGTDKLNILSFDAGSGTATAATPAAFQTKGGAGPRHFNFDKTGKFGYLIEELTGTVDVVKISSGQLESIQHISTLSKNQKGFAGSADIHVSPDQKFLYASNRGDFNNLAIYKRDVATGKLTIAGFQSTLGKAPRNFSIDASGKYLLAGNQDSDEIVVFERNLKTGMLKDNGKHISVGKPVCLKWIAE